MSAKGSCPGGRPHVGDRQVETLTSYTLRADLGAAQPRSDAWSRLRVRIQAGGAGPARSEPTFNDRFWRNLLVVGPRLSSMGVALAMLALFVHSSLIPLAPPAPDAGLTSPSNVPPIKLIQNDLAGVAPVTLVPVASPDAIRQQNRDQTPTPDATLAVPVTPAQGDGADPMVRSRYGTASAVAVANPQVKPNPLN